eukprot:5884557-Prymnesium_polylepis.2
MSKPASNPASTAPSAADAVAWSGIAPLSAASSSALQSAPSVAMGSTSPSGAESSISPTLAVSSSAKYSCACVLVSFATWEQGGSRSAHTSATLPLGCACLMEMQRSRESRKRAIIAHLANVVVQLAWLRHHAKLGGWNDAAHAHLDCHIGRPAPSHAVLAAICRLTVIVLFAASGTPAPTHMPAAAASTRL